MKKVIIVIFCILGMIVGMALADATAGISVLRWLSIGGEIGIKNPIVIDLSFLQFTIGFWLKISIGGVLGMVVFGLLSKVVLDWLKI